MIKKIGRTYTRKIQEENYGGKKYQSSEFGCWAEEEVEPKDVKKKSKELQKFVVQEVNRAIEEQKKEIEDKNNEPPFEDNVEDNVVKH